MPADPEGADASPQVAYGRLDRLFGRKLGPGTHRFLRNLGWIGICFAIGRAISVAANIVAANVLGAEKLGDFTLITNTANLLQIWMIFGMPNSLITFGASKEKPVAETLFAFLVVFAASVAIGIGAFALNGFIAELFRVPADVIRNGIQIAVISSLYLILVSALQASHEFGKRGVAEVLLALLLFPGMALGYELHGKSADAMVVAYLVCYSVPAFVMALMLCANFRHAGIRDVPKGAMLSYGLAVCFGNIGYILTFIIQPFQIEWAMGTEAVGVFRVYNFGSIMNAMALTTAFSTVFYPKAVSSTDKAGLWDIAVRAWAKFGPVALLAAIGIGYVNLLLSGTDKYPLDWTLIALFAVAAILISLQSSIGQIIVACGVSAARWGLLTATTGGLINLGATWLLLRHVGLAGAPIALILSTSFNLVITVWLRHRLLGPKSQAGQ
jgi:O-antigen/teichoic acid export membrane protein